MKLKDRVIWVDDIGDPVKGTIINLHDGITIRWDNGRIIHYNSSVLKDYMNNGRHNGYIDIDLSYNRELKLNELGI